jgi:transposase
LRNRAESSGPSGLPQHSTVIFQKKCQVECSYETVRRLLHEKGYVLKVPRPWPDRQDEVLREKFRKRLSSLAEDPDIKFWYADETGIEEEPKPRRSWATKGSHPTGVHNGDHIRSNILGTVCPRTGEFFAIEASHCDTDVFQAFLDEAARSITPTPKRNILILDNASWHKGKKLNWHSFKSLYLPLYSPDFNPIERIWLYCKNTAALVERADQSCVRGNSIRELIPWNALEGIPAADRDGYSEQMRGRFLRIDRQQACAGSCETVQTQPMPLSLCALLNATLPASTTEAPPSTMITAPVVNAASSLAR